ncbi:MAG: sensor histidine kinase [Arenicella sp.]
MFSAFKRSLSVRLLAIFVVAFLLLVILLRLGVGHSLKTQVLELQAQNMVRIASAIYEPRQQTINIERAQKIAERSGLDIHIFVGPDNEQSWSSTGDIIEQNRFEFELVAIDFPVHRRKHHRHIKPEVSVAKKGGERLYKVVMPDVSILFNVKFYRYTGLGLHWLFIGLLFLGGLYWAIRRLFSPLKDINQVVSKVSQGDFSARTVVKRQDELGALAEQVNQMAADIEQMLEAKRGLLLAISHELRTPITRAKVALELMQQSSHQTAVADDIREMELIINELTEAEKLGSHAIISRQVVSLNELVNQVINEYFADEEIIFVEHADSPFVNVDMVRVKVLIKNLLQNALKYTPPGNQPPQISVQLDEGSFNLCVKDSGVGIEEGMIDKVVEPFYRVDPSRQRNTGGFGLGLYLCKAIAEAHNGSLKIQSEIGVGTQITANIGLG